MNFADIKKYNQSTEGKAEFVKEVLSPLLVMIKTGLAGAEYECENDGGSERVYFVMLNGQRMIPPVNVTADSLKALVIDVLKAV